MNIEDVNQITQEKAEAELVAQYHSALERLEKRQIDDGVRLLRRLVSCRLIQENEQQDLRYSCYFSLAEVYEKELKMYNLALHYFNKAAKLRANDFTIWFRMGKLARLQGYLPQSAYCFFQALSNQPQNLVYENIVFQQIAEVNFLMRDWQTSLRQLNVLIENGYNTQINRAIKGRVLSELGQMQNNVAIDEVNIDLFAEEQRLKQVQSKNSFHAQIRDIQQSLLVCVTMPVYLEKLQWQFYLRLLNYVCKALLFGEGLAQPRKQKAQTMQNLQDFLHKYHYNFGSAIELRELRESDFELEGSEAVHNIWKQLAKEATASKKSKRTTTDVSGAPKAQQSAQVQQSASQQQLLMLRLNNRSREINQKLNSFEQQEGDLEKQVARIAQNKQIPLSERLKDYIQHFARLFSADHEQECQQLFAKLLEEDTTEDSSRPSGEEDEYFVRAHNSRNHNNSIQEAQESLFMRKSQKASREKLMLQYVAESTEKRTIEQEAENLRKQEESRKEAFYRCCNDDFLNFFTRFKHTKLTNFAELVQQTLQHLFENINRQSTTWQSSTDFDKFAQEYDFLGVTFQQLQYCPSFALLERGGLKPIGRLAVKLYLKSVKMCSALCESGDSQPNSVQLTLGELLFDYRAYVLKKHPQAEHNTVHRKTHKIERINRLIEKIINSFFHSTEKNPCFRLRAYRLMALYYSEAHQNNDRWSEHCAEQAVRALLQAYESYNAQNGPCHMFWLQEKSITAQFCDLIAVRLKANRLQQAQKSKQTQQPSLPTTEKIQEPILAPQEKMVSQTTEQLHEQEQALAGLFDKAEEALNQQQDEQVHYQMIFSYCQKLQNLQQLASCVHRILELYQRHCLRGARTVQSPGNGQSVSFDFRKHLCDTEIRFKLNNLMTHFMEVIHLEQEHNVAPLLLARVHALLLKSLIIRALEIDFETPEVLFKSFLCLGVYLQQRQVHNDEAKAQYIYFVHFLAHLGNEKMTLELHKIMLEKEAKFHEYLSSCFVHQRVIVQQNAAKAQSNQMEIESKSSQKDEGSEKSSDGESGEEERLSEQELVVQEIRCLYKCFYGIKARKKIQLRMPNDFLSRWIAESFQYLDELRCLVLFIQLVFPQYLQANSKEKFLGSVQTLLMQAYDYLRNHSDQWAKCKELTVWREKLQKWVTNQSENTEFEQEILQRMQMQLPQLPTEQGKVVINSCPCYCELGNCLQEVNQDNFLPLIFQLCGGALQENDVSDTQDEKQQIKQIKATLRKADRMYQLLVMFQMRNAWGWHLLAGVYAEFAHIYLDHSMFKPMQERLVDLKDSFRQAQQLYNFQLQHFPKTSNELAFQETTEDLLIINLIRLTERRLQYVTSLCSQGYSESTYELNQQCYLRDSLPKKNDVQEIIKAIYAQNEVSYDRTQVRHVILRECLVFRTNHAQHSVANLIGHLQLLHDFQKKLENGQKVANFNGEKYEHEFYAEYLISLAKFLIKFLNLIRFFSDKFQDPRGYVQQLKQELPFAEGQNDPIFTLIHIITQKMRPLLDTVMQNHYLRLGDTTTHTIIDIGVIIRGQKNFVHQKHILKYKLFLNALEVAQTLSEQGLQQAASSHEEIEIFINETLSRTSLVLSNAAILLRQHALNNIKKHKYKRFVYRSLLYSAKIYWKCEQNHESALKLLSEIVNSKTDEIATIYTHTEKSAVEKDSKLCQFFPKEIVFQHEKYRIIKLYSTLLHASEDVERHRSLGKKLLKIAFVRQPGAQQANNSQPESNERIILIYMALYRFNFLQQVDLLQRLPNDKIDQSYRKGLYELYQTCVRSKNKKYVEDLAALIQDIKELITRVYRLLKPEDADKAHTEIYSKAVLLLEDEFKKKKPPTKKREENGAKSQDVQVLIKISDNIGAAAQSSTQQRPVNIQLD